jgi:phosphoglycolate phosphatase-like HAD superfamily hydrolase
MKELLPSWNEGVTKDAIFDFLARVTDEGAPEFVPAEERVAVFDNDGTLWCEKPLPIEADFLLERIGEAGGRDPALRARQPWKAVIEKDYRWLRAVVERHLAGDDGDFALMAEGLLQAYAGVSVEEFLASAARFLGTAEHPELNRPYYRCVYLPMVELLDALAAFGFTNYIVTSGGQDFMRPAAPDLYHVPPERVIGGGAQPGLEYLDGCSIGQLVRRPELGLLDQSHGRDKPGQIWNLTGRRPLVAGGNSDADAPMLHFCARPPRPSLALLLLHDDEEREFAYVTGAEASLARAAAEGWIIASMKDDWKVVFPL